MGGSREEKGYREEHREDDDYQGVVLEFSFLFAHFVFLFWFLYIVHFLSTF